MERCGGEAKVINFKLQEDKRILATLIVREMKSYLCPCKWWMGLPVNAKSNSPSNEGESSDET